ncbi:MAG TPA: sigma 54-interacting transcriptional regulator, partial [Kofleriaceae bacterium]|nr:sigma 54-interacting transcriptional regulator [Kofleriaceae bacterium]
AELAAALYNRGHALVALGAVPAARRAADEALVRAAARGTPEMEAWAHVLDGDVARREGDGARAEAAYRRALAIAGEAGLARARLFARNTLAETLAEAGRSGAQEELAAAAADGEDGSDEDRDRLRLARARVALASGRAEPGLAEELAAAAERGRAAGRLELVWRAEALAARLLGAEGRADRAGELSARARAELERIAADTPEAHRADLGSDPDAQGLAALEREVRGAPEAVATDGHLAAPGHLRRLLALSRRLNSELRLEPLLDDVIDTAIELTSAERGFLLLYPPGRRDRLEIVVARNIGEEDLAGEEGRPSRSIAERAARSGEVQLTVDAAFDERFGAAESVAALRLRSVLAVPLRQKGRVIGTIYVDHRYRSGAFDSEAVELACELADIAAVAIDNARLVEENRRRQEEIDRFNQRLSDDLGEREAELIEVKARLGDDRAGLRHAYAGLVGRSPAMVELLRTLDRVTDSTLPVVLFGESGTGKELVARALHQHGPRRDRPFVAVNCGALPEPLLESELFGHVRGAFTGADRDRRGLFEIADGGTLFLDEIADTSLAMQTRLLRVLQEHEVRRVGDEKTRRVDVRIVAASNRDLEGLVGRGEFREDLYYRLNVVPIRVPPLRERVPDIPELCEHILARAAGGGAPRTIARAALARLSAYPWPGNVRELENELARAAALADGAIEVAHLSAQVAAAAPVPAARPARGRELQLKPQVEALERSLVEKTDVLRQRATEIADREEALTEQLRTLDELEASAAERQQALEGREAELVAKLSELEAEAERLEEEQAIWGEATKESKTRLAER